MRDQTAGARIRGHTLDVEGLFVRYGNVIALDGVSLSVDPGEVVALLGPSGCGKTTLLRTVAGFVRQSSGAVMIDGRRVDDLPPNRRDVGIVFQNYALFPHMSVAENVGYGLRARGQRGETVTRRVSELLELVQLGPLRDRRPAQLSGGQQQRVALARALAIGPRILLLDEPFAALDRSLRLDMQIEIKRLQRSLGLTAVLVTHDQDEAMSVADRIAVMRRGRIEQLDSPVAVYDRPQTLFVAGFIGTANRLAGTVTGGGTGYVTVRLDAGADVTLDARAVDSRVRAEGARVLLSARPEHLVLSDGPGAGRFPVSLGLAVPLGGQVIREAITQDGTALRLTEPRRGAIADLGMSAFCGLAEECRPSLFPYPDTMEE
ncbi:MAG: ABC transporter ATP-binding protein [Acetobacteraceae bacterium]